MTKAIVISNLTIGYTSKRHTIHVAGPMNLEIQTGELVCLIGPNGSGKTTLIRTISNMQNALGGIVSIFKKPIKELNRKALSTMLSIVLSEQQVPGNMKVHELIAIGRYPHTGWMARMTPEDTEKIIWAMKITGISNFANRAVVTLSDGERQKVMIARALAQDTPVILLDEPTAHLDIPNRVAIMMLLRKLAKKTGKAILMSTHELELAMQSADRLWLIRDDSTTICGIPEDLVLEGKIGQAFNDKSVRFDITSGTFKMIDKGDKLIRVTGESDELLWTCRALERIGYNITKNEQISTHIDINSTDETKTWLLTEGIDNYEFGNIGSLITYLRSKENTL